MRHVKLDAKTSGGLAGLAWPVALFAVVAVFFYGRIDAASADPALADCLIGTDSNFLAGLARMYPNSMFYTWGMPRRHLLTVLPTVVVAAPLYALGMDHVHAIIAGIAVAEAAGALCLYAFFRRSGCSRGHAFVGTMMAFAAFSVAGTASSFDSHGISFAGLCFVLFGLKTLSDRSRPTGAAAVAAGLICSVGGLGNAPSAAYALLYPAMTGATLSRSRRLCLIALAAATALAVSAAVPLALDLSHQDGGMQRYFEQWASPWNFLTLDYPRFLLTAFGYALVSPQDHPNTYFVVAMARDYLARPHALAALVGLWTALAYGISRLRREARWRETLTMSAVIVAMLQAFYIYFDPLEPALFAPAWILLLLVPIVVGLSRARWGFPVLAGLCGLMLGSNIPALWLDPHVRPVCLFN